ncbi:hypothetical protein H1230_18295 [Paenibacillus sp. 19GGS1-52]|uniref:hypothetical protein n=1 Tax=Paenibacillus sp. 19GGS1-52 TaxID=2758563 RepID=UPI001EFC20F1|nr:hypothetical protein [Paenibacillus sp. 19GGS1-52]ULO05068.1 hypothetical protein H1230_18295 [Paenibacillus sp. 19GGS1-52]
MKLPETNDLRLSFKLWLFCLIELLLYMPFLVLFRVYLLPEQAGLPWLYVLPLLSLVGVFLRYYCNLKWKQLVVALGLGLVLGALASGISIAGIPLIVAGFICTYQGMTADSRPDRFKIYWAGVVVYFIATIVFHRIPDLQASSTLLNWSGSLCLVLALFMSNSNYLRYSSFSGESTRLPKGLLRHNRLFVICVVIAAVVLAAGAGKFMGLLLWNTARMILGWISSLFAGSETPPPEQNAPAPIAPELPLVAANEPGLLAAILNISFYILGILIFGALAYFALRYLYRNTSGIWRRAIDRLLSMLRKERNPTVNDAFLDEEKNIFTWEKTVQGLKDYWSTKLNLGGRQDRWEQMKSNRERVRWLYRHWLGSKSESGYEVKRYLTPMETRTDILEWSDLKNRTHKGEKDSVTTQDNLLKLYEKVRYGEEEPSEADVTALKKELKL